MDILVYSSESKKHINWPRILLAIIMTFDHCDACLPLIKSPHISLTAIPSCHLRRLVDRKIYPGVWVIVTQYQMLIFTNWKSSSYDSHLVIVNGLTKMVQISYGYDWGSQLCGSHLWRSNCHHNLSDSAIAIKTLSNVVDCHNGLPSLIVINSGALYPLKGCHCCAMFYALDVVLLLRPICKPATLMKGWIAASKAYLLSFHQFWAFCELQTRWVARPLSKIESAYYIAKNASTLCAFQAKLLLLPTYF